MANKTAPHILGTSANLLGFCLIVITSLHLSNKAENHLIDEFTSFIALLLTISSVLSFMSMRSNKPANANRLEQLADYFFLGSLLGIMGTIAFIILQFWKL